MKHAELQLHELVDERGKSVAGLTRGTAGLTGGTVTPFTKENYRSRSHQKDREPSIEQSNGLTTGTHIIYHGSGA